MHPIYTVGYAGWTPLQLKAEATRLGALVLDIRYSPTSMRPEWRKAELRRVLDAGTYEHQPALGNTNYRGGPICLAAPERALVGARLTLQRRPIILLCACRDWQTCHRLTAATYLAEQLGAEVTHLEPPVAAAPEGTIPCLTLQQPWAWAMFHLGAWNKDVENRTHAQFASFRGRLAIHTSQSTPRWKYAESCGIIHEITGVMPPLYAEMDHGKVIGTLEVTDFVTASDSPWFFGPYGLTVRNPQPLATPIAVKGALGIWHWTPPVGVV